MWWDGGRDDYIFKWMWNFPNSQIAIPIETSAGIVRKQAVAPCELAEEFRIERRRINQGDPEWLQYVLLDTPIKTALAHEMDEGFLINGKHVEDPHPPEDRL